METKVCALFIPELSCFNPWVMYVRSLSPRKGYFASSFDVKNEEGLYISVAYKGMEQ